MNIQHTQLASGGWAKLSFFEQMANIGSEVIRALAWKQKHNDEYVRLAFFRALELLSLSLADTKNRSRLPELARMYEVLVDFFNGSNSYNSRPEQLQKQFMSYTYAASIARKTQSS